MNEFILHRDLNIDPLTRLKNFIRFIDEDFEKLFGDAGLIAFFDIVGLREANIVSGRSIGDDMIKSAASVLCQYIDREVIYRTEGDTFTVVLKGCDVDSEKLELDQITKAYSEIMFEKGYEDISLNCGVFIYNERITSIEDFYMFVVKKQNEGLSIRNFSGDELVRHILGGVINRFRQSLDYYEEVYNYALIDEISQLPNAKAANQYFARMSSHTGRHKDRYSILFIDGDDLRRYNDISYEAGNRMIREIAKIIKSCSREEDRIFRWLSGDEFVIVLEETDNATGRLIAQRICDGVEAYRSDYIYDTTVSIGMATYPIDGHNIDQIIYYAEKSCKIAKENGKNQVVSWNGVDVSVYN